jgi:hypothetical protein
MPKKNKRGWGEPLFTTGRSGLPNETAIDFFLHQIFSCIWHQISRSSTQPAAAAAYGPRFVGGRRPGDARTRQLRVLTAGVGRLQVIGTAVEGTRVCARTGNQRRAADVLVGDVRLP